MLILLGRCRARTLVFPNTVRLDCSECDGGNRGNGSFFFLVWEVQLSAAQQRPSVTPVTSGCCSHLLVAFKTAGGGGDSPSSSSISHVFQTLKSCSQIFHKSAERGQRLGWVLNGHSFLQVGGFMETASFETRFLALYQSLDTRLGFQCSSKKSKQFAVCS